MTFVALICPLTMLRYIDYLHRNVEASLLVDVQWIP